MRRILRRSVLASEQETRGWSGFRQQTMVERDVAFEMNVVDEPAFGICVHTKAVAAPQNVVDDAFRAFFALHVNTVSVTAIAGLEPHVVDQVSVRLRIFGGRPHRESLFAIVNGHVDELGARSEDADRRHTQPICVGRTRGNARRVTVRHLEAPEPGVRPSYGQCGFKYGMPHPG